MKLVVFDLDHTLMPIDTGDVWVRWLLAGCPAEQRKEGVRTIERFAREYRAQTLSIDEFEDWQMRFLAGFDREFLEKARLDYKRWYYGHFHRDANPAERHTVLYDRIVRLGDELQPWDVA